MPEQWRSLDIHPGHPELGQTGLQQGLGVSSRHSTGILRTRCRILRRRLDGQHRRVAHRRMAKHQTLQGVPRSDVEQHAPFLLQHFGDAIGKADGTTQLLRPIGGADGLFRPDPRPAEVGNEGNGGRPERDAGQHLFEGGQQRVLHA